MLLIIPVFTIFGCFLGVILFEAVYAELKNNVHFGISKFLACCAWWLVVGLLSLPLGSLMALFNLPFMAVIGMSHCALTKRTEAIITVQEVIRNIPATIRSCVARISPFIK